MTSIQRNARSAGLLYLLMALSAPVGLIYVPGQLFVRGDATATAEHLRAMPDLLRLGIACDLFHQVVFVFLALALGRLFRAVDEGATLQMVVLALVSVPIVFVAVLATIAAGLLASPAGYLGVFDRAHLDALAYLCVRLRGQGIALAEIFWGLWLFPFGALVLRSRYAPRALGWLLWIAGAANVADAVAPLTVPQLAPWVERIAAPLALGELPIIVWLLVRGLRTTATAPPLLPSAT